MPEFTLGVGGAAGEGIASVGDILGKTAARLGLHMFTYNSYQSVIRGGHVWLRLRISDKKVENHGDILTIVIALNQDTADKHTAEIDPGGRLLFNADKVRVDEKALKDGARALPIPVAELLAPFGKVEAISQNTVLLGAAMHLAEIEFATVEDVIRGMFGRKGEALAKQNIEMCRAGYSYAQKNFEPLGLAWKFSRKGRMMITGNEAFSLGAVAAGCRFYSAYPMTPASGILFWMARNGAKCGIVVRQPEDELSVINMAIGAGHTGVRAMCATSGGGFALMTEAVGMAGMLEAPVVCINVMRAGPSTGVPTKTEQADLNQVYGASQGDFPRVILAPRDLLECFDTIPEAFNLAEKYQLPVLIISDLLLSEHRESLDPEALKWDVPIERGAVFPGSSNGQNGFKRYALTENGVSPRSYPGTPGGEHVAATDEHDEQGILISDVFTNPPMRKKMVEKRGRKMEHLAKELPAPVIQGPAKADVTLVGWGSNQGVMREAAEILRGEGVSTNLLVVKYLHPFHTKEVTAILKKAKFTICVEQNFSGQFERHLRAETGLSVDGHIRRYDGEPMEPRQVANEVKEVVHAGSRRR
ncbi:MAG: 2-oxoacid:acceptor oxidoreductase subunit alpha [Planctomycetales bacterium]|nr:2-oxoacid:acceptor oxidoreductase subunit alpha [Planctomycetales bacterium]